MSRSFFEALRHPSEAPFLYTCMQRPQDRAARQRYLQFLAAEGDVRGEALRLHGLLTEPEYANALPSAESAHHRAALRKLLPLIDGVWWATVTGSPQVYQCGSAPNAQTPQVRFRFECPNNWNTLEPTDQADRRFCPSCGEHVYFADSVSRAEQLARQGACIAVPAQLTDKLAKNLTEHCVGRPDWRKMWAERIFGEDREG